MDDEKFLELLLKAAKLKTQEVVTEMLRKAYGEECKLESEQY